MKSGKFDLMVIALVAAAVVLASLVVLYTRGQKTFNATPAIDMPVKASYVPSMPTLESQTVYLPTQASWTGKTADLDPPETKLAEPEMKAGDPETSEAFADSEPDPEEPEAEEPTSLALLTAEWCGPCHEYEGGAIKALRPYFAEKNYHFTKIDIDRNPLEAAELFGDAKHTVPQLVLYEANCNTASEDERPGACSAVKPVRRLVDKQNIQAIKDFLENTHLAGEPIQRPRRQSPESQNATSQPSSGSQQPGERPKRRLFRRR